MRLIQPHKSSTYNSALKALLLIALLLIALLPISASAASVTGKYIKAGGKTTIIEISVAKPAPPSIIVEQSFSNKNKVTSASPKPKKINANGNTKWLLTNTSPGKQKLTVQLATPLKGSVRAILRYRDPANGKFIEKNITP
jgi:hypothetical protein